MRCIALRFSASVALRLIVSLEAISAYVWAISLCLASRLSDWMRFVSVVVRFVAGATRRVVELS